MSADAGTGAHDRFEAGWLALREPADAAARARPLERLLLDHLRPRAPAAHWLQIADLGTGTGSNLRHLAPRLAGPEGGRQRWTLLDADAGLLAALPERLRDWAEARGYRACALDDGIELHGRAEAPFVLQAVPQDAELTKDPLPVQAADLVTGSALLDLVSRSWLARLAARLRALGAAALFALSYDGRIAWQPEAAGDAEVRRLVNAHQQGRKSFGRALGPEAAATAAELFAQAGLEVETAASDWRLGPQDQALQQHLHAGWAAAASEAAPHRSEAIQAWLARRMDLLESGQGRVTVGHTDVLALPPAE